MYELFVYYFFVCLFVCLKCEWREDTGFYLLYEEGERERKFLVPID